MTSDNSNFKAGNFLWLLPALFLLALLLVPSASAGFGITTNSVTSEIGFGLGNKVTTTSTSGGNITYYNVSNFYGLNGTNGTDGVNGTNGINGTNGLNGTNGINGTTLFTSLNSTQLDNSTGMLNIIESWVRSLITSYGYITSSFNATYATWAYNQTYSGSTFNSTYATWAYNQTTPAEDYYNINPNAYYNSTSPPSGGNSTFNQTLTDLLYAEKKWGYNMSDGSFNATYDSWAYNQTTATFNGYGSWWYNMTTPAITWFSSNPLGCYNSTSPAPTFNATYATWAYNQTLPKVIYKSEATTTNISGLTWSTLYTIPLQSQTNYTINCYMLHSSNVTSSGIRYNMTLAAAPDWMVVSEKASTTATASQYSVVSEASISLMPIAVTESLVVPAFLPDELNIFIDGDADSGGNALLRFSGENTNLLAIVGRGSYCEVNVVT